MADRVVVSLQAEVELEGNNLFACDDLNRILVVAVLPQEEEGAALRHGDVAVASEWERLLTNA